MITASIVTYDHHLLDIEPVLRSLFASPVDIVYVIDHSEHMFDLKAELQEFASRVLQGEPELRRKESMGFRLLYYTHENNGYGGGHNYAIKMAEEAGSQYHLVVNPDIWFGPEVMPELIRYMVLHPEVGQMMPKVLYPNGYIQRLAKLLPTPLDIFGRFCFPRFLIDRRNRRYELQKSGYTFVLDVPYLSGCFMMFRMSALKEIDYFDEHFFMYAEDVDITRRMHQKYQTLFYPPTVVYHKFNRASHRSFRLFWIHMTNMIMYFNKWGWLNDPERKQFNARCVRDIVEGLHQQKQSELLTSDDAPEGAPKNLAIEGKRSVSEVV